MEPKKFEDLIEAPLRREMSFWERMSLKSAIVRTIRIVLQYPEDAQKYLDNLPKTVNETIPTTSNE